MAEWSNVPDSKSGVGASLPWVRIPPSPPDNTLKPALPLALRVFCFGQAAIRKTIGLCHRVGISIVGPIVPSAARRGAPSATDGGGGRCQRGYRSMHLQRQGDGSHTVGVSSWLTFQEDFHLIAGLSYKAAIVTGSTSGIGRLYAPHERIVNENACSFAEWPRVQGWVSDDPQR